MVLIQSLPLAVEVNMKLHGSGSDTSGVDLSELLCLAAEPDLGS